jgi:hypothetical protein
MVNFDFDCAFRTTGFALSIYHDSAWKDLIAHGPAYTAEMRQQLQLLERGDRVIYRNVTARMTAPVEDSTNRKINGLSFIIK